MKIPLMFLSDAPSCNTGLARITRELISHITSDPETNSLFRVATLGLGQRGFKSHPYPQYSIGSLQDYVVPELPDAWNDFSRGENGILMTIWNPSWLWWLSIPRTVPPMFPDLRKYLEKRPFKLWGYFPIDAVGPKGTLPTIQLATIGAFDRRLSYTKWAGNLIGAPSIPHGINTNIFYPRRIPVINGKLQGPHGMQIPKDTLRIGICATNTSRKDWGLGAETCAILKERGHKIQVLAHTNQLLGDWALMQLFDEFGLMEDTILDTLDFTEDEMARWYSCCNVTLGIGSGEGFGYPLAESLACGVPCIHGHYAGGTEVVPNRMLTGPIAHRFEGYGCNKRPIYDADEWAIMVENYEKLAPVKLPNELDWNNLWPRWKQWLKEGL